MAGMASNPRQGVGNDYILHQLMHTNRVLQKSSLYIDYPDAERELAVVQRQVPGIGDDLAGQIVRFVQQVRGAGLRKVPSISETLDWALALVVLNADHLSRQVLADTLPVLLKDRQDIEQVLRQGGR
ncbi:MAG: hypothetical protein GKR89_31315 [Candidatus Latescibacteria bacterium]|nr:hypothetical protein [Candidatus Latescibacterota bacterium]